MAVAAPAVFRFTAASNPQRHPEAAQAFGVDVSNARAEDAGELLGDALRNFLYRLGDQPRGIKTLGFARSDIEGIVDATLPQRRVLMIASNFDQDVQVAAQRELLAAILEDSLEH